MELAGAREGVLGAGGAEDDAAVGGAELVVADALELAELADAEAEAVLLALLAGGAEAAGSSEDFDAGEQAAVSASVASSGSASRRLPQRRAVARGVAVMTAPS